MSAYVVDGRTIDYMIAWAGRHRGNHANGPRVMLTPEEYDAWIGAGNGHLLSGDRDFAYVYIGRMRETEAGRILMGENVRSVRTRYPDIAPDDLPGPSDQAEVWGYTFRAIGVEPRPDWTYECCRCWQYQSCETEDHEDTLAWRMVEAIKKDAADAMAEGAPWGVTDADLAKEYRKVGTAK